MELRNSDIFQFKTILLKRDKVARRWYEELLYDEWENVEIIITE